MAAQLSPAERRAEIDERLRSALDVGDRDRLAPARAAVAECDDRPYGQLLARAHDSASDSADDETVVLAATAIELLRGYYRLRKTTLRRAEDGAVGASYRELTPALLSSDYLLSSAYSALGTIEEERLGACFEAFTDASETIVEAFGDGARGAARSSNEYCSFVEDTAGALGRGAAVVGATLGGVDGPDREQFAALGRGVGAVRQLRRAISSDAEPDGVGVALVEKRRVRQYADERADDVERALADLSPSVDARPLRAFVEDALAAD